MSRASKRFYGAVLSGGLLLAWAGCGGSDSGPETGASTDAGLTDGGGGGTKADLGPSRFDGGDAGGLDVSAADLGTPDDLDGDGLTDDVDPEPGRFNALLFEDAFDRDEGTWLFSSTAMAVRTDEGVLSVRRVEPYEREGWIGLRPGWTDYVAQARVRVRHTGTSIREASSQVGLFVRAEQVTPSRYVSCVVDARYQRLRLLVHSGTRVDVLDELSTDLPLDRWLTLTLSAREQGFECALGAHRLAGVSDALAGGSVGFRSFDASFEADFVRVYDR